MDGQGNINVNAPKNMTFTVGEDLTFNVGNNMNTSIGKNNSISIANDNLIVIENNHSFNANNYIQNLKGNYSQNIEGNKNIGIRGNLEETTASTTHIAQSGDVTIKSAGLSQLLGRTDARVNKTGYKLKNNDEQTREMKQNYFSDKIQKTEEIEDIYIDLYTGEVYINYGKENCEIRAIDSTNWLIGQDKPDGEKNVFLRENSKIVTIDDAQIQELLQEIHRRTTNKEQQIYIYLNREEAQIKAIIGPEGTDGEAIISSYSTQKRREDGTIVSSPPMIEVDGMRGALLGQAHTHNFIQNNSYNSANSLGVLGGTRTENDFGTSETDKKTAADLDINIYALDSWNFSSKKAQVTINRVSPQGLPAKNIGKTQGKGEGEKTVNIGLECLNYRIGRR